MCPGVNGERDKDHVFWVDFADDLIIVDERCGGGGGFVHTSKFAMFMVLILFSALAVIVLRMSSGW